MKTPLILIAVSLIVASCATESTQTPATVLEKPYPLETCLVSGDDLDEMDERVATVHEGQTFEFCCKPCLVKFRKDPGKYVAKLAATKR